jgi:hypothetical protein
LEDLFQVIWVYRGEKMTQEEIKRFSEMDETKALILSITFAAIGLFIVLAIIFWPLAGYQLWKYLKIKEAKKFIEKERTSI